MTCQCSPTGPARLARIKLKLKEQMDKGAVVCLQEVSRAWGAELIPFLEDHGYAHAVALYGSPFNGYMGQCVIWPRKEFAVAEVDVSRISP